MWKDYFSKGQRSGTWSAVWKQMHQLDGVLYPALGAQRPQPDRVEELLYVEQGCLRFFPGGHVSITGRRCAPFVAREGRVERTEHGVYAFDPVNGVLGYCVGQHEVNFGHVGLVAFEGAGLGEDSLREIRIRISFLAKSLQVS
jgi:hypothetical protein